MDSRQHSRVKYSSRIRKPRGVSVAGKLQQEIKKRGPFASAREEAILNILRTSDRYQNRFGRLFRRFGLTSSQYNVLRILLGEGRPLPSLEIASRTIQVVPAITGLIDRLEKQGLVTRARCNDDRRIVYVDLTPEARKLLDRVAEPLRGLQDQLLGHLSEAELAQLSHLLEKARQSLEPPTSPP